MSIGVRSSWQVMYSAITCLVIRDIQKKFLNNVRSTRSFGFIWIFLTPLMHVAVWIFVRIALGRHADSELPLPLFILLGVMPFMLFSNVLGKAPTQIVTDKALYMFRQIKPIDTVIAMVITEALILIASYLLILILFWWIDIKWTLYNPLMLFETFFAFTLFLFGIAFILSVAGFFFLFIRRIITILSRILYLVSGVFIPANLVPEPLLTIMSYNPLFQCNELSRQAFSIAAPFQTAASMPYLWFCATVSLLLGLMAYIAFRQKIMIEIEEH
ncbi:ABC transporter permease [Legionella norrlandica]|nr:ABC transporter permease [Legionella norrlandica]